MAEEKSGDNQGGSEADDPRRGRILDAAFSLLLQRGYSAVSTEEIARCARVSKRELYTLFGSKQAILATGIAARARRMRLPADLPQPESHSALAAALCALGTAILREISNPMVVALYRLAIIEGERSADVAVTLDAAGRGSVRTSLDALLRGAQAAGLLRSGETAAMAGEFYGLLWADLLVRLMLRVVEQPSPTEIARRARRATEAFLALHATLRSLIIDKTAIA